MLVCFTFVSSVIKLIYSKQLVPFYFLKVEFPQAKMLATATNTSSTCQGFLGILYRNKKDPACFATIPKEPKLALVPVFG
jgi:hypothetical protein